MDLTTQAFFFFMLPDMFLHTKPWLRDLISGVGRCLDR